MDPLYSCTQSYPYQRDQMHYWPHNYPGNQTFPTQIYANPARPPVNHEYWPWGSNYGYASPVTCHGCGNHNYLPPTCYGWRSPYSHVPPVHCPGSSPFPVQYMPPPPYAMQQPQYEYEKNIPRNHYCCGCPNHQCHQKEQKNIKIEEEEPAIETIKNDSLVPFQFKNYPYPIVYLPHDFGKNKEHEKLNKSEHQEGKDGFSDAKPYENPENVKQQRDVSNKWHPYDLQTLGSLDQRGDGERNGQQQGDDGKGRFPFPIIWMPYDTEEKERKTHKVNNANQEPSSVSVKGSDGEQNLSVNVEHNVGRASSKSKDIPVKDVERQEEKESSIVKEKDGNDNGEKKFAKDGSKSSSPTKSSKLPPVCLRVDPLPRRKASNGSSRSPSPPGDTRKMDHLSSNEARKVRTSDNDKSVEMAKNKTKEGKGITKTIEVADGRNCQRESKDVNVGTPANLPVSCLEEVSTDRTDDKSKEENISLECCENGEVRRAEDVIKDEANKSSKPKLTDEEAAVIIQSAYRGFDVRRWESVKKLRQIANVREQLGNVKNRIQALEVSTDIQNSSKERNIIAETIMSLLLKLDTIQGLHPYVREVRKSVVRQLVSLQEKLDSLINEKSEGAPLLELAVRHDEEALKEPMDIIPSGNANEIQSDLLESCKHHLDGESHHEDSQISEKILNEEQIGEKLKVKDAELTESRMDKGTESASELNITSEEKQNKEVNEDDEVSTSKKKEGQEDEDVGQSTEPSILQSSSPLEVTGFSPTESSELLQGVLDDSHTSEGINTTQFDEETNKTDEAEQPEEVLIEASISPETEIDLVDEVNKENVERDQALDLPLEDINIEFEDKETITEDKVDNKIGDADFGPDERSAQIPENVIPDIIEPYGASDKRELPTEEDSEEKDASCKILLHDDSSSSEEALENSMGKESNASPLAPEGHLEQGKSPVIGSANSYEPAGMVGVEEEEEKSEDHTIAQQREALENSLGKESNASPLAPEGHLEQGNRPVIGSANSYEPAGMVGVEEEEEKSQDHIIAQQRQSVADIDDHDKVFIPGEDEPEKEEAFQVENESIMDTPVNIEVLSEPTEECIIEHLLPKEYVEAESLEMSTGNKENAALARDELIETNGKLIEENERLRDMMEKLIKSGQEQLTAISSLSGRVKDLERRLSRKKKLKMRQYREPRSCMAPSHRSLKERTTGVAM
ncbi:hypothetical protein BUALT_Bualt01G0234700 [Buddleja alternifolia]|uniref:BAG domain-containing protein n=1 Tax=Buddleja alternifolia TaxID=168488 RepID=A0AAV6Y9K2_9LAMI|nr:hypothetical protein BUALT_Bualt01G0234700 [Buddleja alternifolia]